MQKPGNEILHPRGVEINPEDSIMSLKYANDMILFADIYDELQQTPEQNTDSNENWRWTNIIRTKFFSYKPNAGMIPIYIN